MLRQWLPGITGGRYSDVIVDPPRCRFRSAVSRAAGGGRNASPTGRPDQIYLLLRIAQADHLTMGHDMCPLILDDVTVHADSARTTAILALLQVSAERQVILFTQEDQVADWARVHLTSPDHAIRTLPTLPPA
jgi:uncharacterized protein YhaN